MDARDFFLQLYEANHFQGKALWTLDAGMRPHYRTVLPNHNSVAWYIWHIARGEDWTIQTIFQEQEQLLTRDGWDSRMGVAYQGFGGGMTREEMVNLSETIDLDALHGYYMAVTGSARAYMSTMDFDTLNVPFDSRHRLALAPEAQGPSPFLRRMFARWTTPWVWAEVFLISDVAFHIADADHVLTLLIPDRETD